MNFSRRAALFALVRLFLFVPLLQAAPLARSVSSSRQFVVYGPDARLRGAVCDLAERTKKTALVLLQEKDAWKTPIVIAAQYPEANLPEAPPAQLHLGQTGFGLKLQLELRIGATVEAPAVERELLRAIFLEMIYRTAPDTPAGATYVEPPDWLLEGTLAVKEGQDPGVLAQALRTSASSENIIPLEEFLRQRPALLDSPSRAVYRAHAAAFLSLLINLPEGRRRLARFLADLPQSSNDASAELRSHFPVLGANPEEMQKNWTAQVVRFGASENFRLLGVDETERELAQLLRVELRQTDQTASSYSLEEFSRFIHEPAARGALEILGQRLLVFSGRVNPLYRPVIAEYQKITGLLARRKTKRMRERLAELRAMREHISRRMSAIDDYMNWFEATQARQASGEFRDYLKAAELGREGERRRRDPISIYLDALEAQFEN